MDNKIPKLIHYLWIGGEKTKLVKKCISSWKKYLPDYEIIEWNQDNYDINQNTFASEAFEKKKYGFVVDHFKYWVLYNHGGIYLDTDVEVLKSFNDLLSNEVFFGFESESILMSAVIGAQNNNNWIKMVLDYYSDRRFIKDDGSLNMKVNPLIITNIFKEKGLMLNNQIQIVEPGLHIFSTEYFSPKDPGTRIIKKTKNTYTIHHLNASWISWKFQPVLWISWFLKRIVWNVEKITGKKGLYNNFLKIISKLRIKFN